MKKLAMAGKLTADWLLNLAHKKFIQVNVRPNKKKFVFQEKHADLHLRKIISNNKAVNIVFLFSQAEGHFDDHHFRENQDAKITRC